MICENCHGKGYTHALVCRMPPERGGVEALSCEDCNGTGEVSEQEVAEATQRQIAGRKIRAERKELGMILRAYAAHRGISVVTLSALERGKRLI